MRSASIVIALCLPFAALAQAPRPADAVFDALRIGDVAMLLHDEAVASADDLGAGLVPERERDAWLRMVSRINAPETLERMLREQFGAALDTDAVGEIHAFLDSPLGARIVGLELSAREVLNSPGVEEAAVERFEDARAAGTPRAAQVATFIEVNDLIDQNVVGALNANAAFLEGMQDAAGNASGLVPQGGIREEVMRQAPEIREATEDWVTAFVSLAYDPLPDEDFASYIAFSESAPGQALNVALFAAFDVVFETTSRQTGAALAGLMTSEEL